MTTTKKSKQKEFDLEKAISTWKKSLCSLHAVQDGDLVELEGYLRDKIDELSSEGLSEEDAFQKATSEFSDLDGLDSDYFRARSTSPIKTSPPWKPPRFIPGLLWNYFKIVGRKLKRQKSYSFINIAGLTVGMTAFILIILYCRFERSYDNFHSNIDRIFRVQNDRISAERHDSSAGCPPGLAPAMREEFPEVADSARLFNVRGNFNIVSRTINSDLNKEATSDNRVLSFYEKNVFFADVSFLRFFSFPILQGNAGTALNEPDSVVLTETLAEKYFGEENPLYQTLTVTTSFGQRDYRITAVLKDVPQNSHINFDLLLSFQSLEILWPSLKDQSWSSNGFLTYILLSPTATAQSLEAKFPLLIEKYALNSATTRREFHLQPLRDIHLTSKLRFEAGTNGDIKTIVFLEIIGLFILIIAWVNSINLTTARSLKRGKEVCIRKTLGAQKPQLTGQFLFESIFINILAFFLALAAVYTLLPVFSQLVGKSLSPGQLGKDWIWLILSLLTGAFLSGLYPAFILSSFRPVSALQSTSLGTSQGTAPRKILVVFQFSLAILLIIATLTVVKQMAFIKGQDLGADIDQTLILKVPPYDYSDQPALLARSQMSDLTPIRGAAVSTSVPGQGYSNSISGISRQNASEDESHSCYIIDIDDRYFQFFNIPLLAGRTFSQGFKSDRTALILNEEAVKILGFESIEGTVNRNITIWGDNFQVIGVVKNYHHKSLHDKIEPMIFWPLPYALFSGTNYLSLKISGTSIKQVIADVEAQWKDLFPGLPFEYSFLDEDFNQQYISDKRFSSIFGLSSLLAVFISCLGLFGLASFSAERRTREIGIRKVFGAKIHEITRMLITEFIRWVILANLIAWPLAWIIMNKWLERFAYRTSVGLWAMVLAGLCALFIAAATVSYKAVRAAAANPVESIRFE